MSDGSDGDRPWQWERKNARNGPGVGPEAFWCYLAGDPPELQLSFADRPEPLAPEVAPAVASPRKGPHGTQPPALPAARAVHGRPRNAS